VILGAADRADAEDSWEAPRAAADDEDLLEIADLRD